MTPQQRLEFVLERVKSFSLRQEAAAFAYLQGAIRARVRYNPSLAEDFASVLETTVNCTVDEPARLAASRRHEKNEPS